MTTWSTLHIFGYGETQLIGEDFNKKVLTSELTKVQALVDNLYSFKPEEITATDDLHALTIFKNYLGIYITAKPNRWMVPYTELDIVAIEELVAEIEAYAETIVEELVTEESPATETPTEETPTGE